MLNEVLAGTNPPDVVRAEQLRGQLPPGPLGGHSLQTIKDQLRPDRADHAAARGRAAVATTSTSTSVVADG